MADKWPLVDHFEKCPECHRYLVNVDTYAVCPTGEHGKLYPPVLSEIHRKGLMAMIPGAKEIELFEASKVPTGQPVDGYNGRAVFAIQGRQGLYRRITRTATGLKLSRPDSIVAHVGDNSIWEFVRWREIDSLMFGLGYGHPPYPEKPAPVVAEKSEQKELLPEDKPGENGEGKYPGDGGCTPVVSPETQTRVESELAELDSREQAAVN